MKPVFFAKLVLPAMLLCGTIAPSSAADTALQAAPADTPSSVSGILSASPAAPDAAAPQAPPTRPDATPSQSPDALKSFTEQIISFFHNPDVASLWTANSLSAWIMLLVWIFVGMITGKVCSVLLLKAGSRTWTVSARFLIDLAGPANLFLITVGLSFGLMGIAMAPALRNYILKALLLLYYISVFWYAYNLISILDVIFSRFGTKTDSSLAMLVAPLVRRTLRVFLVVIASMFIVQSVFGQQIGAWLAGLGIAGLAVSLAAQDSLKNLIGSITIVLDQSFKIGDRIICSGCDGVIEDIGLRTTRIRTGPGHLVCIPNASIVNSPIENISRRQAIRRSFTLSLKLDTPAEKVRQAIGIVNDILADGEIRDPIRPTINRKPCPPQVFFGDYAGNSLKLTVTYWYAPPNNDQFMAHAEKLNLRILEEFNRANIQLAPA